MRFILLLLLPVTLMASQIECHKKVSTIAKRYTKYSSTIVAIAYTESSCGEHLLGDDAKSLGVMQIQIPTARSVIKWYPTRFHYLSTVSDAKLRTLLLTNLFIQVKIASLLFEHHRLRHGYFGAISRYNGGKNNKTYYRKVRKNLAYYLRIR